MEPTTHTFISALAHTQCPRPQAMQLGALPTKQGMAQARRERVVSCLQDKSGLWGCCAQAEKLLCYLRYGGAGTCDMSHAGGLCISGEGKLGKKGRAVDGGPGLVLYLLPAGSCASFPWKQLAGRFSCGSVPALPIPATPAWGGLPGDLHLCQISPD